MKKILVTGSGGFVGSNLCMAIRRQGQYELLKFDVNRQTGLLEKLVTRADIVFHLAGVNRSKDENEFITGNIGLTQDICGLLSLTGRRIPLVLSSSIHAELDDPYGRSKKAAEDAVLEYHRNTGSPVYVYRFPNIFGKWSRPNYNSVVATFCHNIIHGISVQINNPASLVRFVYIDDVVRAFVEIVKRFVHDANRIHYDVQPIFEITVGDLYEVISHFNKNRYKGLLPDLSSHLIKYLYSTYLSFLNPYDLSYQVDLRADNRGWLFELIKSTIAGQVFVSLTRPGITRGNHYHDTKAEKFCVIHGEGIIRLRHTLTSEVIEYFVSDRDILVVDIPPGYTHSIKNVGDRDMITLFWASDIFNPEYPDTIPEPLNC
jgi:UDP-2-acetamido-2,6-beta-L-arabino-hexul-4-ose reductase